MNTKSKRLLSYENIPMLLTLIGIIIVVILVEFFFVRGMDASKIAFIKPQNLANVLVQVSVTGILALSMAIIMISGGIDLSIGQMICFIGAAMAFMIRNWQWNEPGVALIAIVIAVGFQSLMGLIISRTKLEPFIVSLGFMAIYKGFTYLITNGREITIEGKFTFLGKTAFSFFGKDYLVALETAGKRIGGGVISPESFKFYMPVLLFLILTIVMWLVLKYTKFGRRVYAVGGNEDAAYLAGINVKNFKLLLYGLNGLFVAIATMTQLSRIGTGNPLLGDGKEIEVIAAVVVGGTALSGGKGNMWGTFLGVLLLGIISNALNILGVNPHWQYILRGTLIIVATLLSYISAQNYAAVKKN